jgi:hypothetical protein
VWELPPQDAPELAERHLLFFPQIDEQKDTNSSNQNDD